jgi:hypothetical protein
MVFFTQKKRGLKSIILDDFERLQLVLELRIRGELAVDVDFGQGLVFFQDWQGFAEEFQGLVLDEVAVQ